MAGVGADRPARHPAPRPDALRRAVQRADRRIHLGAGRAGRRPFLEFDQALPRPAGSGHTDLRLLFFPIAMISTIF